jgi:hypothetical protein
MGIKSIKGAMVMEKATGRNLMQPGGWISDEVGNYKWERVWVSFRGDFGLG